MFGVSLRPCDWSSHFVASVNFSDPVNGIPIAVSEQRGATKRAREMSPGAVDTTASATHNTSCSALFGFISGRLPSVHGSYCAFTATPLPHPISQRSHAGLRFSISQAHQMPAPVATKMRTPFLFKQPVWVSPPSPT